MAAKISRPVPNVSEKAALVRMKATRADNATYREVGAAFGTPHAPAFWNGLIEPDPPPLNRTAILTASLGSGIRRTAAPTP